MRVSEWVRVGGGWTGWGGIECVDKLCESAH